MRLHRLAVQAFGPFATHQEVDLDALCGDGLFLLHGATGAGKTSLLDAVCFALYGQVPGSRAGGGAVALRSHHAPPDLPPQVQLDLTVGGRRFEVTRSPAWERPKRRGAGHTTAQAQMVLREHRGGTWVAHSARADEASQLLTDVLGMGREQFTKVVMLPQGEFAAFLRAPDKERRDLLQRLFGTGRFEDVERWVTAHSAGLHREISDHRARVATLSARAGQVARALPPAPGPALDPAVEEEGDSDVGDVGDIGDVEAVTARVADLHREASTARAARALRLAGARAHAETTRQGAREAADRARRAQVLARLLDEQRVLTAADGAIAAARGRLGAGRRAEAIRGHLVAADRVEAAEQVAAQSRRTAREVLLALDADLVATVEAEDVEGSEQAEEEGAALLRARALAARDEAGRLGELVRLEAETARRAVLADEQSSTAQALDDRSAAATTRAAAAEAETSEAVAALTTDRALAATLPAAGLRVERAEQVAAAAAAAVVAEREVTDLTSAEQVSIDAHQEARDVELSLRARRLAGMAAELAGGLHPGLPCAVCGALEHPAPARAAPGAVVDAAAEDAASARATAALAARDAASAARARAEAELAAALGVRGGLGADDAAAEVAVAREALAQAHAAQRAAAAGADAVAAAEAAVLRAREEALEAARGAVAARVLAAQTAERVVTDTARLEAERGADAHLVGRRDRLLTTAGACEALASAIEGERRAGDDALRCRDELAAAALAAGFADPGAAVAAVLAPAVLAELAATVDDHAAAWALVRDRLAEPELLTAAAEAAAQRAAAHDGEACDPQLAAAEAEAAAAQAGSAAEAAAAAAQQLEVAAADLAGIAADLAAEAGASAALRERARTAADLADALSGANPRRMMLSTFVLASRLEQVCEAASARLRSMSDQRYTLVHSDDLARHGARSGLGLRVVDAWTGRHRETTSLSGGETFLASLALALGLADVVQFEGGGTPIETLFVDEGFGTLDEDTLDEVMAVLDQLRAGGRAVGLVSHVSELRTRITSRLEVVKDRTGSRLEMTRQ